MLRKKGPSLKKQGDIGPHFLYFFQIRRGTGFGKYRAGEKLGEEPVS